MFEFSVASELSAGFIQRLTNDLVRLEGILLASLLRTCYCIMSILCIY